MHSGTAIRLLKHGCHCVCTHLLMLLVFVSELVLTEFLVVRHGVQICTSQAAHVPISGQPTTTHTLCQMNVEQLDSGMQSMQIS
jgi:hypothetical protein